MLSYSLREEHEADRIGRKAVKKETHSSSAFTMLLHSKDVDSHIPLRSATKSNGAMLLPFSLELRSSYACSICILRFNGRKDLTLTDLPNNTCYYIFSEYHV